MEPFAAVDFALAGGDWWSRSVVTRYLWCQLCRDSEGDLKEVRRMRLLHSFGPFAQLGQPCEKEGVGGQCQTTAERVEGGPVQRSKVR
jgi:hypothetical protein